MKITKGEAIALNLWGMIKEIKGIDESDKESIKSFLIGDNNGLRCYPIDYFSQINDGYEIELNFWEFLRLVNLYNESEYDCRLLK